MSYFSTFPFIRCLVVFAAGIITGIYINTDSHFCLLIFTLVFILYFIENYFWKISSIYKYRYFNGLLFILTFYWFGFALVYLHNEQNNNNHFTRHLTKNNYLNVTITEAPIEKKGSYKIITAVHAIKQNNTWKKTNGKLLCYITKKSNYIPKQGDELLLHTKPTEISEAKNPGQFDYKQYLYYHNIFMQSYIGENQFKLIGREGNVLYNFAYDTRQKLIRSFSEKGMSGNELAVAGALLFGITDQLEPSLVRSYAATGALHVLSVSGLHVGIIYGFLQFAFSFLSAKRRSQLIKGILILLCIWFYALLTGLTPSVLRSATMFTFVVFGQILSRKSSPINSIAASAFVLLAYNPFLIMEVGFQLSYLAVAGIIFIYPIIYKQYTSPNKIINSIWSITSVSIAAQLATFPLGLLYFHQFPNYFLFSNLIVIPLSGIILYVGILASVFGGITFIQQFFIDILTWAIRLLNGIVNKIEQLPYSLMDGISIGIPESIICYLFILMLLIWIKTKNARFIKFAMLFPLIICVFQLREINYQSQQKKLITYHIKNYTAIDLIHGNQHWLYIDKELFANKDQMLFNIQHNWDNLGLEQPKIKFLNEEEQLQQKLICFDGLKLLILDKHYNYKIHQINEANVIVLTKNCHFSFKYLPEKYKSKLFIADVSNTTSKIKAWNNQALRKGFKFYNIKDNGACVMEL